jgi:hypothetical protein
MLRWAGYGLATLIDVDADLDAAGAIAQSVYERRDRALRGASAAPGS